MLKIILIALVALIGGFAILVATRPGDFRITRQALISAPPAAVFAEVNDFHRWENWSPWAKLDPQAKNSYEGPAAGPGSIFRWAGNKEVGQGAMTITGTAPNERIDIKLEFLKPFQATNRTEFTFKPQDGQTLVTWSMSGTNNFIGKAIGLFMDCEKMVGEQFEKGLAQMKSVAEAKPIGAASLPSKGKEMP